MGRMGLMSFLSGDLRSKIEDLLPRYPQKQAVTLPALHIVQDALRCVPQPAIREIAEILDLGTSTIAETLYRVIDKLTQEHNG